MNRRFTGNTSARPETPRRVLQAFVWYDQSHRVGIARYARQSNWVLDFTTSDLMEDYLLWTGDGIICQLHPGFETSSRIVRKLNCPKVDLAGYLDDWNMPVVVPDYHAAGTMVAQHFYERGLEHFAYFGEMRKPGRISFPLERGFTEGLASLGTSPILLHWDNPEVTGTAPGETHAREMRDTYSPRVTEWLKKKLLSMPKPVGILVLGTELVEDLMAACHDVGLLIPEEVAVVVNSADADYCESTSVPVSSIVPDYETQGYEAAALLDRLMNGEKPPTEPVLIPPKELLIRAGSDVVTVGNVDVDRALRFIRRNLHRTDLFPGTIAAEVDTSVRALYRAFAEHVGLPVAKEITRLRFEKAKRLLATTNQPVAFVADSCGYPDRHQFSRTFKRATGFTPTEYRRKHRAGGKVQP